VHQHSKKGYTVVEDGDCPELKCVIIPSFGKCPPHNIVAVKKASSDFLKGVGDDLEKIQTMIGNDNDKGLIRVELACHFKQVKIKEFEKKIKDGMDDIKLSRDRTSAHPKGRKYIKVRHICGSALCLVGVGVNDNTFWGNFPQICRRFGFCLYPTC
jgi:hypothetical protein